MKRNIKQRNTDKLNQSINQSVFSVIIIIINHLYNPSEISLFLARNYFLVSRRCHYICVRRRRYLGLVTLTPSRPGLSLACDRAMTMTHIGRTKIFPSRSRAREDDVI